uniref:Ig-like domain-containing protein n=1 Tax=Salmo trutta TaxID=8032 RepID=A0A673YM09_SALTR
PPPPPLLLLLLPSSSSPYLYFYIYIYMSHGDCVVSTGVHGVIVLTQKPSVQTKTTGEEVTMDCNIGRFDGNYVHWYKQVPGGVPQYVLSFPSSQFNSESTSDLDYQLIIRQVEAGDSAVYYCQRYDDSSLRKRNIFYSTVSCTQPCFILLTYQIILCNIYSAHSIGPDSTLPPPVLTILPPSSDELKSSKVTLVCLASQMAMGYADVSWTAGGNPVTGNIATSGPVSCLTVDTSEWNQDKVFSCKVTAGSKLSEKGIKKSECSTE